MQWNPLMLELPGWAAAWWLWGRPRTLAVAPTDEQPSDRSITIIIPARNEAEVLPGLLQDLARWTGPARRVLVVDDHSSDGTADVARTFADISVIEAPELPTGWTGKSWACQEGTQQGAHSADDVLVFLDADVRVEPGAIDAVVSELDRAGGLVSVQPFHTTERAYEQLSLYSGLVGIMGTGAGRPADHPPAGAFGPLLATTVGSYQAAGGHAAVRHAVTEDVSLALRYRAAGLPVRIFLGGTAVRFRMYPHGIAQLVEGWTKNMATGAEAVARHRTALVAAWIAASGSAAMSLPIVPGNHGVGPAVGVAVYLLYVAQVWALGRQTGTFGLRTAVLYPVALAAFMALFFRSAWRLHVRRSVRWRGRSIGLGGAPP